MRSRNLIFAGLAVVACSSCVAKYESPTDGATTSAVEFSPSDPVGPGYHSSNTYYLTTALCQEFKTAAVLSVSLPRSNPRTLRLRTGERQYVYAVAQTFSRGRVSNQGIEIKSGVCRSRVSFVPEEGHSYSVKQILTRTGCDLAVTDTAAAGARPPSLQNDPVELCVAP
jgi:hypothetical protein